MSHFYFYEIHVREFLLVSHMMHVLNSVGQCEYGKAIWFLERNDSYVVLLPSGRTVTVNNFPAARYAAEAAWEFVMIGDDVIAMCENVTPLERFASQHSESERPSRSYSQSSPEALR